MVAGARMSVLPTTRAKGSPTYTGSHIFIESEFGRMEVGSPYDAGSKLRITAYDVAAATGDDWSRYAALEPEYAKYNKLAPEFVASKDYFFDCEFKISLKQINDRTEPPRLISFFTPKIGDAMSGIQIGVSYIPDSSNTGGAAHNVISTGTSKIDLPLANPSDTHVLETNKNVKDAFAGGVSYEHNIEDGIGFKVAVTGEYAKSSGKATEKLNDKIVKTAKLNDLKTVNIGAKLNYGNFLYGASYGNLFNSLTTKEYNKTGRNTVYYNGSVAYQIDAFKTSLSYFKSERFKSTVDAWSLGADYKLASGIQPYAEVSYFQAKGKTSLFPEAPKKKLKGTIVLLGLKLSI